MTWNQSESLVIYKEAVEYLKSSLGIVQLDIDLGRKYLIPYYAVIIKFLNRKLITLGSDSIKARIEEIFKIESDGADYICEDGLNNLLLLLGINSEDEEYNEDRLVYSWTNLLSTLCLRLRLQYARLLTPPCDCSCCSCGAKGQDEKDYESWTSHVYPFEEEYDRTNYTRSNVAIQEEEDCNCNKYEDRQ